ncbi:MAG: hypothetical protein WB777_15520, partial [Mycobacterium sp.]
MSADEPLVEPIIVVLGPFGGGTSAIAKVLHHLGVFMGTDFDWTYRKPHDTWEESYLSRLCRRAFSEPRGHLQMDVDSLQTQLRAWADGHRRAARIAGGRPGAKHPLLCVALDFLRQSWGPVVPVVVDRPFDNVVASLNRLGWWADEQERVESTKYLLAARDNGIRGTAVVRVDFEALRASPSIVIRRLADELGLQVTDAQLEAAINSVVNPAEVADNANPHGLDLLTAEVEPDPNDARSVYIWAQGYFDSGDFVNARKWYARQIDLGGRTDEEIYLAMWRIAESMASLDEPWPDVQDAYLRAWDFRPTRAEPLHAIARRYRTDGRYLLGYLFADRAAEIPLPEQDTMLTDAAVYTWRALDEQAVCASWIGKNAEAFTLCRRILARPELPEGDRRRIASNRDFLVPAMIEAASTYPGELLDNVVAGFDQAEVTVSLIAGPDRSATEQTLNSFLHCCTDVSKVGHFLVADVGLSNQNRARLQERYGFLDFVDYHPGASDAPLAQIRQHVRGRFWLHLDQGWRFFAPENLITRLVAVLEDQPDVLQVGVNFADAAKPTGASPSEHEVHGQAEA